MDAFAITGVTSDQQWFRVEGVIGGDVGRPRLYPRLHVMDADEVAELAASGRKLYFSQPGEDAPLVPLAPRPTFDLRDVALEDLPCFPFLERASDEDVDALLAVRMGQELSPFGLRLKRLEALDWVDRAAGRVEVSPVGMELLRVWLGTPPAPQGRVRSTPAAWQTRPQIRERARAFR